MLCVQFSSNDTWSQPFRSFGLLVKLLPSSVAGLLISLTLSVADGASLNVDQGFSVLHSFTGSEGSSIGPIPLIDGSTCYGSASWGGTEGTYLVAATGVRGQAVAAYASRYVAAASEVIGVVTMTTPTGSAGRSHMVVVYASPTLVAATAAP